MSEKNKSTFQWIRDSSLQIVSALIGSSLLLTIFTALYSEFNQPNIYLGIIPHFNTTSDFESKPKVNYYEIMIRNDGKTSATNLTAYMYFFGPIKKYTTFFTDEKITNLQQQQTGTIASLLTAEMHRLASGAMTIIYVWVDANKYNPYFISATFNQGSSTFPVFRPPDVESGHFPNILAGHDDTQSIQRVIIISSIFCVISFTIVIANKKIKELIYRKRGSKFSTKKDFDLILAIPITIILAIFLLYVCEELPKAILIPSLIVPPIDATEGASIDTTINYKGIVYTQGYLLAVSGIFWTIVVISRIFLSYFIAKNILSKLYDKDDQRWHLNKFINKRFFRSLASR